MKPHIHSTIHRANVNHRPGTTMVLMVICIIGLFGLMALAVEVGIVAVARSQAQNAADSAAMTGARTITGDSTNNYGLASAPTNAVGAAVMNSILGKSVVGDITKVSNASTDTYSSGNVLINLGTYGYNYNDSKPALEGFDPVFPRAANSTEPYSAVRATVTGSASFSFARVFGISSGNVQATAVAVHRPRDVFIIMDLSGSMRFQSLPGIPLNGTTADPSSNSRPRTVSMNPESVFPKFGHYSATSTAALQGTTSYSTGSEFVDPANISTTSNSGPPIIEDFYQNASGVTPSSANLAFSRAADSQATTPGGYNYLFTKDNSTTTYGATVNDIIQTTSYDSDWETKGYSAYVTDKTSFYTEGPGYWGKTFFIWPPDPRGPDSGKSDATNAANHANNGAKDWRKRFFFKYNTSNNTLGWLDHNNILFDSAGAPATYSSATPTPILNKPGDSVTVTENGASVTYSYRINYAAILHWLRNESPQPFPTQLRAGRIKYYDAIPDPSDTTLNNRFWTTGTLSNTNERFWRDYINFVLGVDITGTSGGWATYTNTQNSVPLSSMIGNGDFYKWGSTAIAMTQKPDGKKASSSYESANANASYSSGSTSAISIKNMAITPAVGDWVTIGSTDYRVKAFSGTTSVTLSKALAASLSSGATMTFYKNDPSPYMSYTDNPFRPRHQFWFGPMTFVDYLGNYNTQNFMWPGNVHEAQAWACKVGIQTAIDDIKKNHPNDFLGMAFFSTPRTSASGSGYYNNAVVPLGRNYQQLKDSLWFPPSTITGGVTEITPYDTDFVNVPRANGGTAPGSGFMIAYNQLSSSVASLRLYATPTATYRGNAGGLGRKGASRIIIFETDGAPNSRAYVAIKASGSDSYYPIRIKDPTNLGSSSNVEFPSAGTYANSDVYTVVQQICALDSASTPGFSNTRHTAQVFPIGYGSLFDPANSSGSQTTALGFLQTVAYNGNTAKDTTAANFPDMYRIYGTNQQRIDRMKTAFTNIMQTGTQVSLIE